VLNRRNPDDVTVYGYLADANAELGNYDEAVKAAQWMLNLRPGNVAGLTRAAYLRELHGDLDGAIDLMQEAYESTSPSQTEDRAWLLTQMAHLQLQKENLPEAERVAQGALSLFPSYHYALGVLGQVRMAKKQYADAAEFFQRRYSGAPHAENLFALAEALSCAGKREEAEAAFREFEAKALTESATADNANHELVSYYLDYAHQPARALEIARAERARRHDVFTREAWARSLAAMGQYEEAQNEVRAALAFGAENPVLLRRSIQIQTAAQQMKESR